MCHDVAQHGFLLGIQADIDSWRYIHAGQADRAIEPILKKMGKCIHVFISKDTVDTVSLGGQKVRLGADMCYLWTFGIGISLRKIREAETDHGVTGILDIVTEAKAIPAAQPFNRFAHQRDGQKFLSSDRMKPRLDMLSIGTKIGVFQFSRTLDGDIGKGFECGFYRGGSSLRRREEDQPLLPEYQHS